MNLKFINLKLSIHAWVRLYNGAAVVSAAPKAARCCVNSAAAAASSGGLSAWASEMRASPTGGAATAASSASNNALPSFAKLTNEKSPNSSPAADAPDCERKTNEACKIIAAYAVRR